MRFLLYNEYSQPKGRNHSLLMGFLPSLVFNLCDYEQHKQGSDGRICAASELSDLKPLSVCAIQGAGVKDWLANSSDDNDEVCHNQRFQAYWGPFTIT